MSWTYHKFAGREDGGTATPLGDHPRPGTRVAHLGNEWLVVHIGWKGGSNKGRPDAACLWDGERELLWDFRTGAEYNCEDDQ